LFIREYEKTDIETGNVLPPDRFSFCQNYPNPFNPSTRIRFYLPSHENVTVKVLNTAGREIETLMHGEAQAGRYDLTWSAENLAGGVYIYSLQAGRFHVSKKMILQK